MTECAVGIAYRNRYYNFYKIKRRISTLVLLRTARNHFKRILENAKYGSAQSVQTKDEIKKTQFSLEANCQRVSL